MTTRVSDTGCVVRRRTLSSVTSCLIMPFGVSRLLPICSQNRFRLRRFCVGSAALFSWECRGRLLRGFGEFRLPGELADCLGPILDADVRVSHRHLHVRMPGELLGLGEADAVAQQLGNVRMAAGCMEIGQA